MRVLWLLWALTLAALTYGFVVTGRSYLAVCLWCGTACGFAWAWWERRS